VWRKGKKKEKDEQRKMTEQNNKKRLPFWSSLSSFKPV
jgi:hypothetical protein